MEYTMQAEAMIDRASVEDCGYAKKWLAEIAKTKYICIFGAGTFGHIWADLLEQYNIHVDFVCDNDAAKWGSQLWGHIQCLGPKDLEAFKDDVSVIIATRHFSSIEKQLKVQGFCNIFMAPIELFYFKNNFQYVGNKSQCSMLKKNILRLLSLCADEESKKVCLELIKRWLQDITEPMPYIEHQYFVDEIMRFGENEVFVDAGAFDGDSIQAFLNKVNYRFGAIHAFEMDRNIYSKLQLNINKLEKHYRDKIFLYNLGVWNEKSELLYSSNDTSSQVSSDGAEIISMDRLDGILKNVSFLKMDIEGAELQALQGAQELILRNKPKLAICVYHLAEHLWEIPFYIKKLVPEYKIYFRHHTSESTETVCYACI